MRRILPLTVAIAAALALVSPQAHAQSASDRARWQQHAADVTIIRDRWGIAHVFGKTDADAVFGMIYAQAEDDFNRVETNYINSMGRLAEVEGEREIWRDLRMKLFIDTLDMKRMYGESPAYLKKLMDGWADGLNFFLNTHPATKPRLLTRFEPWMALTFSEGSIGGDIESVNLRGLEQFYGKRSAGANGSGDNGATSFHGADEEPFIKEPGGSNGFAIAPSITADKHAILWINPHTSFYFRPEIHVNSAEGLNAYGAVTWGQFFIYQGFNPRLGWMHTSGGGDVIDEYVETVTENGGKYVAKYGAESRPVTAKTIVLPYKTATGMGRRTVTAYFTSHGPVIRESDGKWVAVKMMNDPMHALMQSYGRTKAKSYAEFTEVMKLRTNSSNNTVYADGDGNIALFFGNFVPKRNPKFDYTKPLDGSDPATDWQGLHDIGDLIKVSNPKNGWIQNTNNAPWQASGPESPKQANYLPYMSAQPENWRGVHAVRVLSARTDFTPDRVIAAAYDSYLPGFAPLLPALFKAYDATPASDTLKAKLGEQIALLKAWDLRFGVSSVGTSLATYYGDDLMRSVGASARAAAMSTSDYMEKGATPTEHLTSLMRASNKLQADFGTWKTPWGEINRFQRLTGDIVQPFDDSKPSLAVGFASATWGSLAAIGMTTPAKTKRIYGDRGNSFVSVVQFGPRIKAKSILAGGVSGDPKSPHFKDQAEMYARGEFKDVLFYREDIEKAAERTYHPGK